MSGFSNIKNQFPSILKKCILFLILLVFAGLLIEQKYQPIHLKRLNGYFIPREYTDFSFDRWFTGEYQKITEDYLNEEFGFRNFFVRLDNQIRFSFFRKTRTTNVVIGENNFLYEYGYIIAYNGVDFIGEKPMADSVAVIKKLQDTLQSLGKHLLIVLAPSKVRTYPEYILDSLNTDPSRKTNYQFLKKYLLEKGVNYIDFNSIFENKKNKSNTLLYPQLGIHWSRLEAVRAFDTIVKKLNEIAHVHLPELKIKSIVKNNELESPEDDIIQSMNILTYPNFQPMSYPEIEFHKDQKDMRDLLVVADSYWWDIFLRELPKKTFANNEFWYYNKEIWNSNNIDKLRADSVDRKRHLLQNDLFVFLCTESNFNKLGFGFFSHSLNALRRKIEPSKEELKEIIYSIKKNPKWMEDIHQKAIINHISVDSMISLDANWAFQHKGPIRKKTSLKDVKKLIVINKKWMEEICKKAIAAHVPLDSMISNDAKWYLENVLHITDDNSESQKKNTKDLSVLQIKELIKHNQDWMKEITYKAKKRNISIDSCVTLDAIWFKKNTND